MAEEENYDKAKNEFVWLCDPVDGTIPFSFGIPISTFTLSLVHNGESIVGVIANPFVDKIYSAEKGKGAHCNGSPIKVSKADSLVSNMVATEYWAQIPYDTLSFVKYLEGINCNVPILKSIAISGGLTASGETAGFVFPSKTPWDVAASKIIVEEAGGRTTDLYGNEQRYDKEIKGFVASNGILHDELLKIIKKTIL